MNARQHVDLASAARVLAVANTPSFLCRKLREDNGVRDLSRQKDPKDLLDELRQTLKAKPLTLEDAVYPYVLLVGLSWFEDLNYLRKASALESKYAEWYTSVAEALLRIQNPTTHTTIVVPTRIIITGQA